MVSNAARQLAGEQQPQQVPRKKTYQQPKISPSPVRWSKFERSLVDELSAKSEEVERQFDYLSLFINSGR